MSEALQKANELQSQRQIAGFDQTALDDAARRGISNGAFEDSEEDSHGVIEEFFTHAEPISSAGQGESSPAPTSLAGKLDALVAQVHCQRSGRVKSSSYFRISGSWFNHARRDDRTHTPGRP